MGFVLKLSVTVVCLAVLTACGGGGTTNNVDPQGIWSGKSSNGYSVDAVVLDTGEAWGVYSSGSTIYGALYGYAKVNGSNISINGTDFNFLSNRSVAANYSGSVIAKSSMSLSGNNASVPLTYQSIYDAPATISAAMGSWSFDGRSGGVSLIPGAITVDGSGRFNLNQPNCVTTGVITPRPGGKNIYNISMTATGSACIPGLSPLDGVTYLDKSVTPNRFLTLVLNKEKSDGLIVIGTKQ